MGWMLEELQRQEGKSPENVDLGSTREWQKMVKIEISRRFKL